MREINKNKNSWPGGISDYTAPSEAGRCLNCQQCEMAKEEGRVQGFWVSSIITMAVVGVFFLLGF